MDLIAIAPDEAAAGRTKETVREILQGRRGMRKVSIITTTRNEFRQWALLAQSFSGQAARYGVTPDGRSLDYRAERGPAAGEMREMTIWWLRMAEVILTRLGPSVKQPPLPLSASRGRRA